MYGKKSHDYVRFKALILGNGRNLLQADLPATDRVEKITGHTIQEG